MDALTYWEEALRADSRLLTVAYARFPVRPQSQYCFDTDSLEHDILQRAATYAADSGIPFWDAVLLLSARGGKLSPSLMQRASTSYPENLELTTLTRTDVLSGDLRRSVLSLPKDEILVLASEVTEVTGKKLHFPMIDLRSPSDSTDLGVAIAIGGALLPNGYAIFDSGNSFHIVGTTPVPTAELSSFLIACLFFCPLVDRHYVAHHLRRQMCTLRISSKPQRHAPTLLAINETRQR